MGRKAPDDEEKRGRDLIDWAAFGMPEAKP